MTVNGKILTVEEREDLWAIGWDLLPKEHASKTRLINPHIEINKSTHTKTKILDNIGLGGVVIINHGLL
jgi:hypothetical protein